MYVYIFICMILWLYAEYLVPWHFSTGVFCMYARVKRTLNRSHVSCKKGKYQNELHIEQDADWVGSKEMRVYMCA
jgi:hypothetical protein